jgi:hypothetical protein
LTRVAYADDIGFAQVRLVATHRSLPRPQSLHVSGVVTQNGIRKAATLFQLPHAFETGCVDGLMQVAHIQRKTQEFDPLVWSQPRINTGLRKRPVERISPDFMTFAD